MKVIKFDFQVVAVVPRSQKQNLLLESFCCKKSPNQEIGLRRFSEYRTSEGSECYQIDPR